MGLFDVVLTDAGKRKINVIKEVRGLTNLGLKDAKDLIDGAPNTVLENVSSQHAENAKKTLETAGASVTIIFVATREAVYESDEDHSPEEKSNFWDSWKGSLIGILLVIVAFNFVPDVWDHFFGEEPDTFTAQEWADFADWCEDHKHSSRDATCAEYADWIMESVNTYDREEECVLITVQRGITLRSNERISVTSC